MSRAGETRLQPPPDLHKSSFSPERCRLTLLISIALLFLAGCAGTGGSPADRLLRQGDFDAAIVAFEAERARRPHDPGIARNLGISQFEAGRTAAALQTLEEARELDPRNAQTLYFLGRTAERAKQYDLALDAYTAYLDRTGKRERVVRARIQAVSLEKSTAEVLRALERERELSTASIPQNTVVVSDFENSLEIADLDALSHGLAAVFVTDLSQIEELRVLERARLQVLLGEIELAVPTGVSTPVWDPIETIRGTQQRLSVLMRPDLGEVYYTGTIDGKRSTGYTTAVRRFQSDHSLGVDGVPGARTWAALREAVPDETVPTPRSGAGRLSAKSAPRIGRVLGARRLIQGTFAASGGSSSDPVQLGAAVLDVTTGTQQTTGAPVAGTLSEILQLEKTLVYQVLETMGIDPSAIDRRRIDRLPTRSFLAFLAYSRGLYLEAEGQPGQAIASYREAVRLDPGFAIAQDELDVITVSDEDQQIRDRAELEGAVRKEAGTGDRLNRTGAWSGIGPGPDESSQADRGPDLAPDAGKDPVNTTIIVGGDLPPTDGLRAREGGR